MGIEEEGSTWILYREYKLFAKVMVISLSVYKLFTELSKFTHEVEEQFNDVKEHMIISVERHSFLIAFVLMSATSAILLIGTIYVWCFHRPRRRRREETNLKVDTNLKQDTNKLEHTDKPNESDSPKEPPSPIEPPSPVEPPSPIEPPSPTTVENNKARKRIPSNSSLNNNESPVKSKIPIRTAKVKAT